MSHRAPSKLRTNVFVAIKTALVGSALLATCEVGAIALAKAHYFEQATIWHLLPAAWGKLAISHLMLWGTVLVIAAVLMSYGSRLTEKTPPESWLVSLFVVLAGLVVGPADLGLAGKATGFRVVLVCLLVVVCGAASFVISRRLLNHPQGRSIPRIHTVLAGLAGVLMTWGSVSFARSPLYNPAAFRVPRSTRMSVSCTRPNVLWVVLDTVRADRTNIYGYDRDTTPYLGEFASKAIVYENALSTGTWTVPAHSSMFTGLSRRAHGVDHGHTRLEDSFRTVADILGENGYETVALSANPWISRNTNILKGFDVAHIVYHLKHVGRSSFEYLCEKWGITPPVPWLDRDFGAALTNHLVHDWLTENTGTKPFFLFVNYLDAHLPYAIPKKYRQMTMSVEQMHRSYDLRLRTHGNIVHALDLRYNIEGSNWLSLSDREIFKRQYEAAIRYLDDRLRELIGMFEQRGLLDNTLVVICSDHGEYLDTHGMWAHRFVAYEDLTRVITVLREPGRDRPLRIKTPVLLSDLYQTVINAALGQTQAGPGYDSRDLLSMATSGDADRIVISEYAGPSRKTRNLALKHDTVTVRQRVEAQLAARDARYKLLVSPGERRELYDLVTDPGETNNLAYSHPQLGTRLEQYIEQWLRSVPEFQSTTQVPSLDHDLLNSLRSLGYVGD